MKRLTARDRLFCFEYIADAKMNPEKAAIKAGYSPSVARKKSYTWVGNSGQNPKPEVKAFIDELLKKKEKSLDVTIERIRNEYIKMAFSNAADIIDAMQGRINLHLLKNLTEAQRASIAEISETEKDGVVTRKIKMHPKMDPLKQLEKMLSGVTPDQCIVVNIMKDGKVVESHQLSGDQSGNSDKL